jgi:hypothetical protein
MARWTSSLPLWFPLAAAPALWAAQGLLGWLIASHACAAEARTAFWSPETARWSIGIVTALALLVTAGGLLLAVARWRAPAEEPDRLVRERSEFLAFAGLLVASALLLGIALGGLPALLLRACGHAP